MPKPPSYIDPLNDLGKELLRVEKPARYAGGEYGILSAGDGVLLSAICFPDLYEIGMSNQALRILYNRLNNIEGVSCDRAFAPAPDFEALLKEKNIPLYGLDTGIVLRDLDLLMFTLGYELGMSGVFSILQAAGIPFRKNLRDESHPLIIMGGPCVSNPLPYASFVDAFWIGEAEDAFFDLARELRDIKDRGEGKGALLAKIVSHPSVWASGKTGAKRAVDRDFSSRGPSAAVFPVPGMKAVQHHGALEIMRGCPNGCRFCHAGIWYRPMRQKDVSTVQEEASAFIRQGGYREISLSSLSTGDYRGIEGLVNSLNRTYASSHVSFQLPSLKVSSFSLPLLASVSEIRKSGLTFAVETPRDAWQFSINKDVYKEDLVSIILEAKKQGWRSAKFYFMIGLPVGHNDGRDLGGSNEETEIVDFILDVYRRTGIKFNVNVGSFIPKPHTPYQWTAQIDEGEARKKLYFIRDKLKPLGFKVGIHDPFISLIEGLISRGDERAGDILEEAFLSGCRLDAWSDYFNKDIWRSLIEKHRTLADEILGEKDLASVLPWDGIDSGVSKKFLLREYEKSREEKHTPPCSDDCGHNCGICGKEQRIEYKRDDVKAAADESDAIKITMTDRIADTKQDTPTYRIVFSFKKQKQAVFLSHLSLVESFSMAFVRADIPVLYSKGFNPLPRLDFASPLSLGLAADNEIATVDMEVFFPAPGFADLINKYLPPGLIINEGIAVTIPVGEKKHSASSLLWGFEYSGELVPAAQEKIFRQQQIESGHDLYMMKRSSVLARSRENADNPSSYFSVYKELYPTA
ncbi:TIGR03936 family radical SAM-associated protein [Treponema sp. OttesenSCG-928-L16]|nr:TIGR03936 family radical SAM-associated protein [Treponema sp. OttesenSCG-928-L16]